MEKSKNQPRHIDMPKVRLARYVVLILAIIVSSYLSWLKISSAEAVCIEGGKFDCGTVLNSFYSEIKGIPIAWLGLAVNLIAITLLTLEPRVDFLRQYGVAMIFGLELFAFMFSVYLVYVQAFLIQAYCPWCLSHELFITIIFILSAWRLRNWELGAA
jgi:uncharacterized membrane protein